MTFKEALDSFKSLYYQRLSTNSITVIARIQRDWNIINSNLHLYYVAYNDGDTDVSNECLDDIFDVLNDYDITDVDLPVMGGGGGGVVPTNGFLDWVPGSLNYLLYSTQQGTVSMDSSSTNPILTTRVNINGNVHGTRLTGGDVDVLDGGEVRLRRQVIGVDTDGDVRLRADASGYFIERRELGVWQSKGDITF